MSTATVLFYLFEFLAAASAVSIVFIRNVFYAALLLIVCLLSIAGIYVLAFAEFLAVTQILVYAGGVLVVIIFGIMLTAKISGKPLKVSNANWFAGAFVGLAFFSILIKNFITIIPSSTDHTIQPQGNTYQTIGVLLMSDYILPFEIIGILLLVTLVGSVVTAAFIKPKE